MSGAIVYRIICAVTGKLYIGVTRKTLAWRWSQHLKEARANRFQTVLYRAIRKHGPDQFVIEPVYEAVSAHEAQIVERALIAQYGTLAPLGMNTSTGGENHAGRAVTPEVRALISAAKRGKKLSEEVCRKMSVARAGIPMSAAQKAAHSAAMSDPAYRARKSAEVKKRLADPEYRARQFAETSARFSALWQDPAFRERQAARLRQLNERKKARVVARPIVPKRSRSEVMRDRWKDPVYRARLLEHLRAAAEKPDRRERLIQRNVAGRGKKRRSRAPEVGAATSARMSAFWADPAFRARVAAGTRAAEEARLAEALLSAD